MDCIRSQTKCVAITPRCIVKVDNKAVQLFHWSSRSWLDLGLDWQHPLLVFLPRFHGLGGCANPHEYRYRKGVERCPRVPISTLPNLRWLVSMSSFSRDISFLYEYNYGCANSLAHHSLDRFPHLRPTCLCRLWRRSRARGSKGPSEAVRGMGALWHFFVSSTDSRDIPCSDLNHFSCKKKIFHVL